MQSDSRRNMRKQFFDEVERMYQVNKDPKDDVFYYHPNEDRIVLSHALFWSMTHALEQPFRSSASSVSRRDVDRLSHRVR